MWESLATTRRQDRVLHGVAKVVSVIVAAFAVPLWLVGQRLARPFQRLLGRLDRKPVPLPVPPSRERSMDALMADLEAIPSRIHRSRTAELRKGVPDFASFILAQRRATANLAYAYPAQFRHDTFEGADGERIAGTLAVHETPRPALVVVHGLFSTHRFDYVREIAVRAFYEWGFNVCAVDLRSFGVTDLTTNAPSTGGWKEGEDIVRAGRHLKELGSTSVGALGISLGASSVLNASHPDGADAALDGGILAVCGPADTRKVAERLSRELPRRHPAYPMSLLFRKMLISRVRDAGWPDHIDRLVEPIEEVSAPYYGVSADEIWRRSSAVNHIADARVPVLALHSEDDLIIPVEHARMLAEAAAGNPNVRVWIVPGGSHAAFDAIDADWTYAVYRNFFERWADYPGGPGDEMVYSRGEEGKVQVGG
jgi:predicted alpha/beta-fold hydrolase